MLARAPDVARLERVLGTPATHACAGIVPFAGNTERGAVVYEASLAECAPLDASTAPRANVFRALADVAAALRALHARGYLHGALRPDFVWLDGQGAALLLAPERAIDPRALLQATLRAGVADPSVASFVAPEVLAGHAPSPAADVYALAATAYHSLTGELSAGQLDLHRALFGAPPWIAHVLHGALSAAPATRPPLTDLEHALRAIAHASDGAGQRQAPAVAKSGSELSAILVLVFIVGGIFVFSGAIWLVAVTWSSIGELGRFALLAVLTGGVWAGAELARNSKYPRSALALEMLACQLLWADAGYLLFLLHENGAGAWSIAASCVSLVALALALRRRSLLLGVTAAANFAVVAGCFGAFLSTGAELGPLVYAGLVGLGYAAIGAAGAKIAGRSVGVPFAVFSAASLALSACLALVVLGDHTNHVVAIAWPYVIVAALAVPVVTRVPPRPSVDHAAAEPGTCRHAAIFGFTCALVITFAPTFEALIVSDSLPFLFAAVGIGAAVATAGFVAPPLSSDPTRHVLAALSGAIAVTAAPGILALEHLDDARPLRLAIALGVGGGLVLLAYFLSINAAIKSGYRLLEGAGLLLFFGLLTLASLMKLESFVYPGVLLAGGLVVMVLGSIGRRATLVGFASSALLLNLWIQYFGKLKEVLPTSLLLVGFGLGLLAGGFSLERKVRALLPELKSWA